MQKWHRWLQVAIVFGVGGMITLWAALSLPASTTPRAWAQDGGGTCEDLAAGAIADALAQCPGTEPGTVCAGHGDVTLGGGDALPPGETVALADVESVTTGAADVESGAWGVARLSLPGAADGVPAVLFGAASLARPAAAESDRPTLEIRHGGGAAINLRNGAGITYEVVGQLQPGENALADGRNEQADWLRIQYADGIAWVFTPLITWDGDAGATDALEVLLPNDVTPAFAAGEPFQAVTLATGAAEGAADGAQPCAGAPSGLLLQYSGAETANVQVNQVTLEFSDATLLVTAAAGDALEVKVLAGTVTATARGVPQDAAVGQGVRVALSGADGLTPAAAPTTLAAYPFPAMAYAPLDLLPGSVACMVGVPAQGQDVALRVGPGANRGELGSMSASASYPVLGWANDPEGAPWWEVDTGGENAWVAQAAVRAVGACADVAQVEAPPLVIAPAVPAGGDSSAGAGGADLAPAANSVWQMNPGTDNMSGECSGAPAINFCEHLAAIAPVSGGITWKGMEPTGYTLAQVQPNVYSYAGPNAAGNGTISLTLSFTSETALKMTMSLVLASEPNCQHVYYYTGTRNW